MIFKQAAKKQALNLMTHSVTVYTAKSQRRENQHVKIYSDVLEFLRYSRFTYRVFIVNRVDPRVVILPDLAQPSQIKSCVVVNIRFVPSLDEKLDVEGVRPVVHGCARN